MSDELAARLDRQALRLREFLFFWTSVLSGEL